MYYIIIKFLSREPKKTMNFIRDIAIPIILLLAVGAIISSVNLQLTNLLTIGGQNDVVIVRNVHTPIEDSIIPASALENISHNNIEKIIPVVYMTEQVVLITSNQTIHSKIQFVGVNISDLNDIIPFQTLQNNQITNNSNYSLYIGSQIISELSLDENTINNDKIFIPSTNTYFNISGVIGVPDIAANNILINFHMLQSINSTYNYKYYSELMIKVQDRSKIVSTINNIQDQLSKNFPNCDCNVIQGSGTSSLLENVISTIVEQLAIFNLILDIIIIIRVLQSLFWIANDYKYELNELRILGASKYQIYILFLFLSVSIGNLGILLGMIGSIVIPTAITYLIAILTIQTVSVQPPSITQMIMYFFQVNALIIIVTLFPAYQLASKKIIKQKERE